jgi:hypothetical protein
MGVDRVFGRRIVRNIYGFIEEEESWRVRTDTQIQGADTVKLIKSLI